MKTYRLGNIEVLATDLIGNWETAVNKMDEMGEGWRFPTLREMEYMVDLSKIGIFKMNKVTVYWLIDPETEPPYQRYAQALEIYDTGINVGVLDKEVKALVRPVRDI